MKSSQVAHDEQPSKGLKPQRELLASITDLQCLLAWSYGARRTWWMA